MSDPDELLPFLELRPFGLASCALVVGDPRRAESAAELLTDPKLVGDAREYKTFTGAYKGKRLTIASHGVGGAGASICFKELIQGGVKTIIRAGTCAGMRKGIEDGDLIIGTGAIREDGTSEKLVPITYPAVVDRHVITALEAAAAAQSIDRIHEGIILTQDYFYPGTLPPTQQFWIGADVNVAAVEMELATLLIVASLYGVRAGGIFTSDGNMAREDDMDKYNPHRDVVKAGVQSMLRVALDALASLA
ncbi:MAG: nucleoside phosphorylase [Anaerolineales bacterium]|jgi:uridine phosphorylase